MAVREPAPEQFPFGIEFQHRLLRMLAEDDRLAADLLPHLRPEYFGTLPLRWAVAYMQEYRKRFAHVCRLDVLIYEASRLLDKDRAVYSAVMQQVADTALSDTEWLQETTFEFVRRGIFVTAMMHARPMYNSGRVNESFAYMQEQMELLGQVRPQEHDWSFFFESFATREAARKQAALEMDAVGTGLPWLDNILCGGLHPGELGMWIADAKIGKSTMLVNLGLSAVRCGKRVYHLVLEGGRGMIENRYDAAFLDEKATVVRAGGMSQEVYQRACVEYEALHGRLVVHGMTDKWSCTIEDLWGALTRLKKEHAWEPDLVVVDYGDLMNARQQCTGETQKQKEAFRDLKSLANRGYAVWTATQSRRQQEGMEDVEFLMRGRQVADCYEKVRIVDFVGSLNQTVSEAKDGVMRLFAELYRSNAADSVHRVRADMERMRIYEDPALQRPPTMVVQPQFQQQSVPL